VSGTAITASRPWPVTALAAAVVFHLGFTFYNVAMASLQSDGEFEAGRLAGAFVGTLLFGGLIVASILSMSRWPYVFFGLGFLFFA
jgi:hypothetical protein